MRNSMFHLKGRYDQLGLLDDERMNAPLNEMTAEILSRVTYDLQTNIMPWLSRCLCSIEHVLERLVEVVEVSDSGVTVCYEVSKIQRSP